MAPQRRNRRAGVEDRWADLKTPRQDRNADGTPMVDSFGGPVMTTRPVNYGKGRRWRARYVGDTGREHARSFTRKIDAQLWLNGEAAAQESGTWVDPRRSATAFLVAAQAWFETKSTKAPKTIAGYRSLLDTVVLPQWGNSPVGEIAYEDVQTWVTGLSNEGGGLRFSDRGLSPSRVIQAHQVMSQILRYAVRAKMLTVNPALEIELPRKAGEERRYLTHAQVQALAAAAGRFRVLVLVLAYCGIRFGEAGALRVGQVDGQRRRLRVAASVTRVDGKGMVEGAPKNRLSRSVPVPEFVMDLLSVEINGRSSDQLVFPGASGGYLGIGEFRWWFDKAAAAAGVEIVPHELRHSAASLAIKSGANIKAVQQMLGHKTATLTLDRYGHLYDDDLDAVGSALHQAAADALRTVSAEKMVKASPQGA